MYSTENRCYRIRKYIICKHIRTSFSPEIVQAGAVKGLMISSFIFVPTYFHMGSLSSPFTAPFIAFTHASVTFQIGACSFCYIYIHTNNNKTVLVLKAICKIWAEPNRLKALTLNCVCDSQRDHAEKSYTGAGEKERNKYYPTGEHTQFVNNYYLTIPCQQQDTPRQSTIH